MAVTAAVSALGLAALVWLPGQPVEADEGPVPGAESLHVTVQERSEERLRPGDRVEYTIRVRNSGPEALPDARVEQFLPASMRYVSGAPEGVERGRAEWERPLEPGERAVITVVGELSEVPEGAARPVATVCLSPAADAAPASCASAVHQVQRVLPVVWVVAALLAIAAVAIAVGGYLRYRGTRGPRPEPEAQSNHSPGSVPNLRTFPGRAPVYHLDSRR
ncbi:hypothetical protein [Nocardiopsis sp. NPDC006938]|uniref:hypothetical protein n=1 Tax=Nocardiopsis sp. NPDC006938 TaxID=3364337 RepID=UPI0036CBA7BC